MRILAAALCLCTIAGGASAANPLWLRPGWYLIDADRNKFDGRTPILSGPYPDEGSCALARPASGELTLCRYFATDPDAR